MTNFFRPRKASIRNASFALTEEGRAKTQEFNRSPEANILIAIETADSSLTPREISARIPNVSTGLVEKLLPVMLRKGLIRESGVMGEL